MNAANPDEVLQQYAEGLLKRVNPYLWAFYLAQVKNDYPGAIAAANAFIAGNRDPKLLARAYILIADALNISGRYWEATVKCSRATELDPKSWEAYHTWGFTLALENQNDDAINMYRKALELEPNPKSSLNYLGWGEALAAEGRYDEAIKKYREAIDHDPKDGLSYQRWGDILFQLHKYDEARAKYRKAVELDPYLTVPNALPPR